MSLRVESPAEEVWDWSKLGQDLQHQILREAAHPVNHLPLEQHQILADAFHMNREFFENLFPPVGGLTISGKWPELVFRHRTVRLPQDVEEEIGYALVPAHRADVVVLVTCELEPENVETMHTYEVMWAENGWQCGRRIASRQMLGGSARVSDDGNLIAHVRNTENNGIMLSLFGTTSEPPLVVYIPSADRSSDALLNQTGTHVALLVEKHDAAKTLEIQVFDTSTLQNVRSLLLPLLPVAAHQRRKEYMHNLDRTLHWADAHTLRWLDVEGTGVLVLHAWSAAGAQITHVLLENVSSIDAARVAQTECGTCIAVAASGGAGKKQKPIMLALDPTPRVADTADSMEVLWNVEDLHYVVMEGPYAYRFVHAALEIREIRPRFLLPAPLEFL